MAHGLTLERRLTLISRAAAGRPKTRNHPGTPPRPILIDYHAKNPCPRSTGIERIIEIHNIQASKDGNIVLDAWCRMCGRMESFRLDRITRHRALRVKFQGPMPPVTPFFTALGPVGLAQLTRPISNEPTPTGIFSIIRSRDAEADRFRTVLGPAESYPPRTRAVTGDDLLREMRRSIRVAADFNHLVADLDLTSPAEVLT